MDNYYTLHIPLPIFLHTYFGNPGWCGDDVTTPALPGDYGIGNRGLSQWLAQNIEILPTGVFPGGTTPMGYGSGGTIATTGCFVTFSSTGTCIFPSQGRNGVVIIDVSY